MSWIRYRNADVEAAVEFTYKKLVSGACRACERKFEVLFTMEGPNSTFEPYAYDCPCGAYVYYPDDDSESVNDDRVPERREQSQALAGYR